VVWVAEILYKNRTESRNKLFFESLIFLSLVFSLVIILFHPFEYNTPYIFGISRWSYVIVGRFLSASVIIILLFDKYHPFQHRKLFYILVTVIFLGLYLSGLRAGFIFSLLASLLIFFNYQSSKKKYSYIFSGLILQILFFAAIDYFLYDFNILNRYLKLLYNQPRIEALQISWELFKENPFLGVGFGGFANSGALGELMKYPHNLIAESFAEFGVLGLIWLISLFIIMVFNNTREIRFYLFLAFLLSMTSKDISTNTMLWIGLVGVNSNITYKILKKFLSNFFFSKSNFL